MSLVLGCTDAQAPDGGVGLAAFPPPAPPGETTTTLDDFAGAEACAECHAAEYRSWAGSTHGRAGGEPGPDIVIAPFDESVMRFSDATVIARRRAGAYEFLVRQDGFPETVYPVSGVVGGGHMIGGGTQGFLGRFDDGTERFLPWDWSRTGSLWFCNTGSRTNQGWVPIDADMALTDCGDWPPLRPIGTIDRFANCQECHGSQILTTLDVQAGRYLTQHTTLQVNCESCHGPARRHVEMAQSEELGVDGDIGLPSLAWMGKDESLSLCFRCHALKDVLREGYLPGEELESYYALKFPTLGDQPYLADGRVRTFAYQATHLASACYLQGPMDCVSCHEPHAQGYWDVNREPLASPFDDGQCTSCHASKAVAPEVHSKHAAGDDGVRCVDCHMPYLQHPEVGDQIPFARSDHTIANPRPVFDADLGLTGACQQCHADRSPLQLQSEARELWGELKPHRPLITGQVAELRARNAVEAAAGLLHPEETDPLLQFQALARLLTTYLTPDAGELPAEIRTPLESLAATSDLDVRALALAALHWTEGDMPETRALLVQALESSDRSEALRGRWVLALGFLGDQARERGDVTRGEIAYRKALQLVPGDSRVLANLGMLYSQAGRPEPAIRTYRESLAADDARPLVWVNLGIALDAFGDRDGARAAYEEAIDRNPYEALAHFNLGNLLQVDGDLEGAAGAYRRAVEADPGLGRGHFELARTLIRLERYAEALPPARRAQEFLRNHAPSRQMVQDLEQAVGR